MISMAKAICIIPARLESSRFPNKILTDIQGMPMFERVYHIAQVSGVFSRVFIASPNPEILELCDQAIGAYRNGVAQCNSNLLRAR